VAAGKGVNGTTATLARGISYLTLKNPV
jgi:hypothetical protein